MRQELFYEVPSGKGVTLMKNYREQGYVIETKDPRIEALAD